jgi:hypothetical protein
MHRAGCLVGAFVLVLGCASGGGDSAPTGPVDSSIGPGTDGAAGDGDAKLDAIFSGCDPATDTCPPSQYCSAVTRTCLEGCRLDAGCPSAKPHCDVLSHTCAACLTTDQCPSGQACSDHACVPACSATRPCDAGGTCCSGACVDVKANAENCGACGTKCAAKNGTAACSAGTCAIGACADGFADCDKKYDDGCEVVLASDPNDCGKCGAVCGSIHGTASCTSGACGISCAPSFGDCNGRADDGCEVDLRTDPKNCGKCGVAPSETCNVADDDCNGACDDLDGCRKGINRSYDGSTGEHFYTDSASEAVCCGFTLEYANFYYLYVSSAPGLVPFYRCYGGSPGRHFYTTDAGCEGIATVEAPMGFIATSAVCGATPLYRMYRAINNDHFYTTSDAERAAASGYVDQGIAGYVWTGPRG